MIMQESKKRWSDEQRQTKTDVGVIFTITVVGAAANPSPETPDTDTPTMANPLKRKGVEDVMDVGHGQDHDTHGHVSPNSREPMSVGQNDG